MSTNTFLRCFQHFAILHLAILTLITLAWSIPVLCGEIHDEVNVDDLAKLKKLLLKDDPVLMSSEDMSMHYVVDWAKFKELLKDNPEMVSSKDKYGGTLLHWAADIGDRDVAELLLANKADVNVKDNKGYTPLHMASVNGNKDVAELLRQHGGHE
jgi:ankyrin repeat protein